MAKRGIALTILAVLIAVITTGASTPARADGASEFSGVVVSAGTPQAGVTVGLGSNGESLSVTTGVDGSFDVVVPSGSYQLSVGNQGGLSLSSSGNIDLSSSVTGQTLELRPVSLSVDVGDSSGAPISGALVSIGVCPQGQSSAVLQPAGVGLGGTSPTGFSASTDGSGEAALQVVGCGTLTVTAPGYVGYSTPTPTASATLPVTLYRTGETETFAGIVQDGDGDPLSNVTVDVSGQQSVTGADGSFSLAAPISGSAQLTVSGSTANTPYQVTAQISLLHDETGQTLTLPIQPFAVTVTDSTGNPVAGVSLTSLPVGHGGNPGLCSRPSFEILPGVQASGSLSVPTPGFAFTGTTDENGTISGTVLCSSVTAKFFLQPPTGQGLPQEDVPVQNQPTTTPTNLNITLPTGSEFSGVVVSAGTPQAGVTVGLGSNGESLSVTTGVDGSFDVVVPSGSYQLSVGNQGGLSLSSSGNIDLSSSVTGQTLELRPVSLSVDVGDSSGAPISGALVSIGVCPQGQSSAVLQPAGVGLGGTSPTGFSASTDGSGEAALQVVGCGTLTVTAPGYVGYSTPTPTASATLPVTLYRTGETETFAGIVQDGDGDPLSNVTVDVSGQQSVTGADGSFSLAAPISGSAQLTVSGSTANTPYQVTAQISLLHDETGQTLTLPIQPFAVTVTDSTGNPVAGVSLTSLPVGHGGNPGLCSRPSFEILPGVQASGSLSVPTPGFAFTGTTDENGTISGTVLCSSVTAKFFLQPPTGQGLPQEDVPVQNQPTTTPTNLNITLPTGSEFSGVVVSAGTPQAGVTVGLGSNGESLSVTTGVDGSFDVVVPSGSYQLSVGNQGGLSLSSSGNIDLSSSVTGQTLELRPVSLSVDVGDSSGAPISGALVSIGVCPQGQSSAVLQPAGVGLGGTSPTGFSASTDGSGEAALQVVGCGTLTVTAPGYVGYSTPTPTASATLPVTLYRTGETETFAGIVQDGDGDPLSNVTVDVSGQQSVTGADGSFSLAAPISGSAQLTVSGSTANTPYQVTAQISLLHDETGQTLTLPIQPFAVTVTDSTGNPVAGVSLTSLPVGHGGNPGLCSRPSFEILPGVQASGSLSVPTPGFAFTGTTDENGTISGTVLCSSVTAKFFLQPPTGQGLPQEDVPVQNQPTTTPTNLNITLASLFGSLTDTAGQALADQSIALKSPDGSTVSSTVSGSSGNFAVTVPPGSYDVNVSGSVGDPTSYSVTVPSVDLTLGQQTTLTLPTESLSVSVTDPGGRPVTSASIHVPSTSTSFPLLDGTATGVESADETTDAAGMAILELLPTTSIDVTVTPPTGSGLATKTTTVVPSSGATLTVQLAARVVATNTLVSSSVNPSAPGQQVTFAATVSPVSGGGTPTGTVQFYNGSAKLGGLATLTAGRATTSSSSLTQGSHTITAVYSGDSSFTGSTSPAVIQSVRPASKTTLTSSVDPSVAGQQLSLTANVAPLSGGGNLSGTVQFYDGSTTIGAPVTVGSNGKAQLTTHTLAVGAHPISAAYSGNANFIGSRSTVLQQQVNKASTKTTLASGVNPSLYGQQVTLTAMETPVSPGAGSPAGTVQFYDGSTKIGAPVAVTTGKAQVTTGSLTVGAHHISAVYSGDANFIGSASPTVTQTVNKAGSNTTVVSSSNPSVVAKPVTFSATVSPIPSGAGSLTGTLQFYDGTSKLGGAVTLTGGKATFTTAALKHGRHSITAVYSGDGNFTSSTSSAIAQTVN